MSYFNEQDNLLAPIGWHSTWCEENPGKVFSHYLPAL
jgi:hypothetical protein